MRSDNAHLQCAAIEELLVDKPVLVSDLCGLDAGCLKLVDALVNGEYARHGIRLLRISPKTDEENHEKK